MNTVWADRAGVHEALTDVDDLRLFLRTVGVADLGNVTPGDLAATRRLRDALRRLAADVTGDDRSRAASALDEAGALAAVNAALGALPRPRLRRGLSSWVLGVDGGGGVAAALGALAREGAAIVADPARPLRACHAPAACCTSSASTRAASGAASPAATGPGPPGTTGGYGLPTADRTCAATVASCAASGCAPRDRARARRRRPGRDRWGSVRTPDR